ncbi:hypothetical protein L6164_025985 [Bauhinia variegata]|uniref:Uncharacterized protein n=1 Tax=Bauhinia variegata TaxID=167791 RepID=A0ACB9M3X3_BAUVA|nr:hypothetical protein L6164_025985 [Bauhinia variegata]
MEEAHQVAEAIFENLPKRKAEELLKSIDKNGDDKISVEELKGYLKKADLKAMAKSNIFSLIDRNKDGYLQFDEVVTLSYVINSSRPVCNHCKKLIPGAFLTCKDCHWKKPAKESYNLCIGCYKGGKYKHKHDEFLDNYTLFEEMQEMLQESSFRSTSETNKPETNITEKGKNVLQTLSHIAEIVGCTASVVIAAMGLG